MKSILAIVILFATTSYGGNLGQKLNPKIGDEARAAVGIRYAYEIEYAWDMIFSADLTPATLVGVPTNLFWNFVDSKGAVLLPEWNSMNRSELFLGSYTLADREALIKFLPKMKEFSIIISADKKVRLFRISIKDICQRHSANISDLTNSSGSTCNVNLNQTLSAVAPNVRTTN